MKPEFAGRHCHYWHDLVRTTDLNGESQTARILEVVTVQMDWGNGKTTYEQVAELEGFDRPLFLNPWRRNLLEHHFGPANWPGRCIELRPSGEAFYVCIPDSEPSLGREQLQKIRADSIARRLPPAPVFSFRLFGFWHLRLYKLCPEVTL